MLYTFKQALDDLSSSSSSYRDEDLKKSVNRAMRALASLDAWKCMRRMIRFSSVGPCFTLPQGLAGLVRVCVNGRPSTVRGQDFRFIQSGPGDRWRVPPGFTPVSVSNVLDNGTSPLMLEPPGEFQLFAFSDSFGDEDFKLTVSGVDPSGRRRTVTTALRKYEDTPGGGGVLPEDVHVDDMTTPFSTVTSVVLPDYPAGRSDSVTLYCADMWDPDRRFPVALYDYRVKAPQFRRYEIPGIHPHQHVELLVEARIDPLPLVNDDDVLPFETLDPIEWMIRSDWAMKSGEPAQAQSYRDQAAACLKRMESVDDTVQTQIVVNSVMIGTPGEISYESENI